FDVPGEGATETSCADLLGHVGCGHGGWRETPVGKISHAALGAARAAADYAARDLGLDTVRLRFFGPGPIFHLDPRDPDVDKGMVTLNVGPPDPSLKGKPCQPDTTPLPTVWVRSGLSPVLTALVVLHEVRHVWQFTNTANESGEADEADAHQYARQTAHQMGYPTEDISEAVQEAID